LLDILATSSLASSKGQAKQLLAEGSITINGQKATAETRLTPASLLHGSIIAIRRGKKNWHVTRWD
ncbi:MAG: tyrosine--tRNA ligase, partial [Pyrinomonadaceae bacterium]|nr:tyrosine--tRNA ligase [Phycisphaerales bacterium]